MEFQPSDYLNDLNLDFDQVSPTLADANDLALFSKSDFFDLELSSTKPQVKQEPDLVFDFGANGAVATPAASPGGTVFAAAHEDKRKRNTAASARFRVKKKLKEQQMEARSKELQERVSALEKKLKTLEMENKCLKNLILQKNERKNDELLETIKKRSIIESTPLFEYTK